MISTLFLAFGAYFFWMVFSAFSTQEIQAHLLQFEKLRS